MQERRRQKLEWVRGAKEASALMAEIDLARGVLAQEETEWIRSADDVQAVETRASEASQTVAAEQESQSPRRAEIDSLQQDCREQLETARAKRRESAKLVTPAFLAKYARIREGRAPLAMYELHVAACGHCYTAVPMHLRQQIQHDNVVATCEACGVILYVTE